MNHFILICFIFHINLVKSANITYASSQEQSIEEQDSGTTISNVDPAKEFWDRINHNGARRGLNMCSRTVNLRCPPGNKKFSWKCYNNFQKIMEWLRNISIDFKSRLELKTIGITHEKRPIQAVLIKQNSSSLPILFVEAGIYGNEWGSTAFALYLIHKIVNERELSVLENWISDALFKKHNWFIIPIANPDGYEYAYNNDVMWEKNRRPPHGTNINRNFDVEFGVFDSSVKETDNTYPGIGPFSEAESRAIKESIELLGPKLKMYLSYHDYYKARFTLPYERGMISLQSYDDLANFMGRRAHEIRRRVGSDDHERWWDWSANKVSGESWQWVENKYGKKYGIKSISMGLNPGLMSEVRQPMPAELIEQTCKSALETLAFMTEDNRRYIYRTSLPSSAHMEFAYFVCFLTSFLIVLMIK